VARRARWGGTWRRGDEIRTTRVGCGGGGWGWVPFIGSGMVRRGSTGEAGGRHWWGFNSRLFRGVKGGGQSTGAEQVREGGRQWHTTQRRGRMGGGGLVVLRKEKGPEWAIAGPQRPGGLELSSGLKQVDGP
jgi:hypothetical protein